MIQNQDAPQIPQVNLDLSRYRELKEKGILTLEKIGSGHVLCIRRWDISTGEEIEQQVVPINIKQLEEFKAAKQAEIDVVTSFISDLQALDAPVPQ